MIFLFEEPHWFLQQIHRIWYNQNVLLFFLLITCWLSFEQIIYIPTGWINFVPLCTLRHVVNDVMRIKDPYFNERVQLIYSRNLIYLNTLNVKSLIRNLDLSSILKHMDDFKLEHMINVMSSTFQLSISHFSAVRYRLTLICLIAFTYPC